MPSIDINNQVLSKRPHNSHRVNEDLANVIENILLWQLCQWKIAKPVILNRYELERWYEIMVRYYLVHDFDPNFYLKSLFW